MARSKTGPGLCQRCHRVRQILLLGADLDSRAFRMEWPEGTRPFERAGLRVGRVEVRDPAAALDASRDGEAAW
ncbi:class I SAM-dependent methyltransferase [Streptomyces liliifuscus]|uniref:Class I SAM-dependent methyltransferase n=1 Tax=Streptomyces liliifuscus TaxID=2797636 RepID=A0A7T7L4D6_9ACTN|nr:class I SAM-dependent methyltransferase [Streptomyces liliifuscus]